MTTTYYKLTAPSNTFYAIVVQERKHVWDITVGGKQKGCVWILVRGQHATMERVAYDKNCDINGNMGSGEGGTVPMIRAAIALIFRLFPRVPKITFQDHSYVECKGKELSLAVLSLVQYHKTWYQRHFGARLARESEYLPHLQAFVDHVNTSQEWTSFSKDVKFLTTTTEWKRIGKALQEIWNESARSLVVRLKQNKRCDLCAEWLSAYFTLITQGKAPLCTLEWEICRNSQDATIPPMIEALDANPYIPSDLETRRQNLESAAWATMGLIPRKTKGGRVQKFAWEDA